MVSSKYLLKRGKAGRQQFYILSEEKTSFPPSHVPDTDGSLPVKKGGLSDDLLRWKVSCALFKAV